MAAARAPKPATRRTGVREAAAQATRDSILRAATKVFARYGYDGGSVEKISKAAGSYDRMIYYYFGSKEGLFIAVLEGIYRRMDDAEAALHLDASRPVPSAVLVALPDEESRDRCTSIAQTLRARGIACEVAPEPRRFGRQIRFAEQRGIPFVWCPGDPDEVKDIRSGDQVPAEAGSWRPSENDLRPQVISQKVGQ